jgi:hypothetical protein
MMQKSQEKYTVKHSKVCILYHDHNNYELYWICTKEHIKMAQLKDKKLKGR